MEEESWTTLIGKLLVMDTLKDFDLMVINPHRCFVKLR